MSLQAILDRYFTRELPPNYDPMLKLEVGTHDPARDNTRFRMSDAGKCRLMRYWKRLGIPGEPYHGNPLLLESGNLWHAYIQKVMMVQGLLIACEELLEDAHRIGHFDMLVNNDGQPTLYELKTVSDKQFYFKKKNGQPDKPHIFQLVSYASAYALTHDALIAALRIVYLNRDSLELLEYPVEFQQQITAASKDWELLIDAWNNQQAPQPNAEPWECKYCQYDVGCHSL